METRRLFEEDSLTRSTNWKNINPQIFPKHMAPLPLVAGDALVKLIASARSFRHNNPRGFFLTLSFASLSLLFLLTATQYSASFSPTASKEDEDAVLSYEEEKRTRDDEKNHVDDENNLYGKSSESGGFLWWEGAANVALACACAATIGILVAARRARKIFLSSSQQQRVVEGQSATAGIGRESGGGSVGKSWNGSQWVEATTTMAAAAAPSVLSSPYRNSSGAAAAAARPPDANWAKAKGGAWSSENGSNNNGNNIEDDGTDFATGFGYSEGVSSETARERAYRETLWARREAEELEAEENEEDQRNHHEYFTKHDDDDDDDDDNRHRNRSNSSRKPLASTSSAPRKEKESAAAKRERRWSKFDQRWESLDASAATSRLPLTYNDIPWPPKMAKLLDRKVSEHEKKSSSSSSSSAADAGAAAKKKIYRELLLRWHPDKFMQKYGKRVRAGGDEDRIKERVDAVAKALSASMAS